MKYLILIQIYTTSLISEATRSRYKFPPLGLMYISSMARLHGYNVEIIDFCLKEKVNKQKYLMKRLLKLIDIYKEPPLFIGFSAFTETYYDIVEIGIMLKENFPKIPLIIGGAHAKACCQDIMKSGIFDMVCLTEGEGNIIEIVKALEGKFPLENVRGISWKDSDGNIRINEFNYISNLNLLPFPDFFNIDYRKYRDVGIIVTSRGCPGQCIFCASRKFSGSKYRAYSAKRVFAIIIFLLKIFRIRGFGFMDDTFTVLKKRTLELTKLLKEKKIMIGYSIKSRVDLINEDVLESLSLTGCRSVHIGVESADDNVLAGLKKGTNLEKNLKAIELLAKYGIMAECSLMIGNPSDTKETIYKTIILSHIINKYFSSTIGVSTPYPGTELYERRDDLKINIKIKDWRKYDCINPIYETDNFTLDFIRDIRWKYETDPDELIEELIQKFENLANFKEYIEERLRQAYNAYCSYWEKRTEKGGLNAIPAK